MWERSRGRAEFTCAVVLLVVYGTTMAPTLTWAHHGADGGDLVTSVARGSLPHPPGFPTYLLLGELFIRLPWGDPAWRLNLMSAVLAAGAVGLTASAVRLHLRSRTHNSQAAIHNLQSAICAGFSLGLAPLFWSQALIAEVYAPAAFFAALVMYLVLRRGPAWALGLVWGVGIGVHPILLFLAPLVTWGACKNERQRLRRLTWGGFLALLGWGAMYGPVLLVRGGVPSPWGHVNTLDEWWALVSGRLYHRYVFGLPPAVWPQRILAWAGFVVRQFTPFGALLAGLGWLQLWREQRVLAGISALSVGAFSFYAVGYDTADSVVYLVPALPLVALWMGAGLVRATVWLSARLRWGAWMVLLLPLLQALLFWGQMDVSGQRTAVEWAERVLEQAPAQAVLLTAQDAHTFTLWYVHDALGKRPDVVVVDQDLWAQSAYRKIVAEALGSAAVESSHSPEEAARWARRPIVHVANSLGTEEKP
jgi:hypothetical protein